MAKVSIDSAEATGNLDHRVGSVGTDSGLHFSHPRMLRPTDRTFRLVTSYLMLLPPGMVEEGVLTSS
jgi:hypothetical protein